MIINSNGPVYKQVVKTSIPKAQEPKKVEDKQVVAEDKKVPLEVPKKSKAKKKKEES